ncbi:unnamed protein product [Zymoseptoria tritici ST99CH_1A5]|uniref:JmjC domain-containing protein n=4 Tax=Zymoseptoria tritici TaxID=1047171 RepID=F9XNZ9_ZYMTI|nr:uncharacterized protein MYCGRDRAFT_97131 [Zymoseptoria tritici IPO323]SMQ55841.1 unnamed protein product [Zymoseptoria tritici ST99CH_3D7]SMR61029.1 unnamed protein product [Zymoseptoria tritici ST99CH_1E4]SMR64173.1 unnamed protein product [Zymoseptoria tritici ST99CH_3D1]SMY29522.1 unnamed protein product [Zymoseptoria tritici ST99CH_1A5]EGP82961.1 hypothetical protein MYCGRDRAFT_97131 [Zymoseptoria tritici IPO323]
MPAQRPRASFEPIAPDFNLKALVEQTPNFSYVDRISCDMIEQQGMAAFEKLVTLHVIVGGKPLVIDNFEERLDPWTFTPKWLRDNCGDKVENARNLTAKENLPLTMAHYLNNMGLLTNQFFDKPGAYKEKGRQRVYLKDIDCPGVWWDKLKEHIPANLSYLNDSTGEVGGPGAVPDNNVPGRRLGKGIARAGDLMSSLPPDMRAENLMCYIGHEGTYTPSHREMCASLGQNIMVEASNTVSDEGKAEKPGSSIWFMTESKDRHLVSEYWLSVLGHDIEVENHFAQVVAWKKAPFKVYVVEQRPGDFILIPPLAPHQVWNRGTRTMKVAWNRTTVETLEMAMNEALPRSRIVCREEQYKNKAIVYYTLQKYASLLTLAMTQAKRMPPDAASQLLYTGKVKQLIKDFKRLFALYRQIMLSEMFNPEDRDAPKSLEYLPFDSNVTCAYCRGNIFNRFLTCGNCKDLLGHHTEDGEGDPYDVCMDCYTMGRSCACVSGLRWVEQFRWKELQTKYDVWRKMIIELDQGQNAKTPLPLIEERRKLGKKTLAEVCKEQLKRRPFKDVKKSEEPKDDDSSDEEIVVGDDGKVRKITKKKSKTFLKNNLPCHVCCHRHPTWKMAKCTTCDRSWCYGSLFRGWDKMPIDIMEDPAWECPHCLGICFAGACKKEGKMQPYEPKGTLLGHDTKKVADARSVEALVDFSVSNLNWLKDDAPEKATESRRFQRAREEARRNKENGDVEVDEDDDMINTTQVEMEYSPTADAIDPALMSGALPNEDEEAALARQLREANSSLAAPAAPMASSSTIPEGYAPLAQAGYSGYGAPPATMYPQPGDDDSYPYPGDDRDDSADPPNGDELRPFRKRSRGDGDDDDFEDINMSKAPKQKKPRLMQAGFRSFDLAESAVGASASKAKNEAQRQFEKEKERKALEKAKAEGRFIMLQAAIKGKKRIVKLPISSARLAHVLAQQTALAALAAPSDGNQADADAEHEDVDGGVAVNEEEDLDALLKSDLAPKKTPSNNRVSREQKMRDGIILTGSTKKALVPVEKDEEYGYRYRERLPNGKRVQRDTMPPTAASAKSRREGVTRGGKGRVEYEEVDIGSDDEFDEELDEDNQRANGGSWSAINSAPGKKQERNSRRSLPSYLQERQGDDDFPEALPENYREKGMAASRAARASTGAIAPSDQLQAEVQATVPSKAIKKKKSVNFVDEQIPARRSNVGGKGPSMRPPSAPILGSHRDTAIELGDDASSSDDDVDADGDEADTLDVINQAANGDFGQSQLSSSTFMGDDDIAVGGAVQRTNGATNGKAKETAQRQQQERARQAMDEANRMAKLAALEMFEDEGGFGL